MTRILTLLLFFNISLSAYSNKHSPTTLSQMLEVNAEWAKQPETKTLFSNLYLDNTYTHKELITQHLKLVVEILEKRTPVISNEQRENRAWLLERLEQYYKQSSYPINNLISYHTPIFIDNYGTHCAVGYLMQQSGNEDLALEINAKERFAYIKDIQTDGVGQWAAEHGFTLDELAWIQPGYPPTTQFEALGTGTNGPVDLVYGEYYKGRLVIAGQFTTFNSLPCTNIGYYKNGQLSCFGNGLNGEISAVMIGANGTLIAAGNIIHNGQSYPYATYNDSTSSWSYQEIPTRSNVAASTIFAGGQGNKLQITINHPTLPDVQEIWHLQNNGTWEKKATVNGKIFTIGASQYGRIYAGHFDTVTIHGAEDRLIAASNIVLNDNDTLWYGLESPSSDTIFTTCTIGNAVYFGGSGSVCLSRYLNGQMQILITNAGGNFKSIRHLLNQNYTSLLMAGDFEIAPLIGTHGTNLGFYDAMGSVVGILGSFNAPVNSIANWDETIYLGGGFTSASYSYVARIATPTGIQHLSKHIPINIYPNPAQTHINIDDINTDIKKVEITDLSGKLVIEHFTPSNKIDISTLSQGMYLVRAYTDTGSGITKLCVNR